MCIRDSTSFIWRTCPCSSPISSVGDTRTVSYTHLDVYKRQELPFITPGFLLAPGTYLAIHYSDCESYRKTKRLAGIHREPFILSFTCVPKVGFEPTRGNPHYALNVARLPVSPLRPDSSGILSDSIELSMKDHIAPSDFPANACPARSRPSRRDPLAFTQWTR